MPTTAFTTNPSEDSDSSGPTSQRTWHNEEDLFPGVRVLSHTSLPTTGRSKIDCIVRPCIEVLASTRDGSIAPHIDSVTCNTGIEELEYPCQDCCGNSAGTGMSDQRRNRMEGIQTRLQEMMGGENLVCPLEGELSASNSYWLANNIEMVGLNDGLPKWEIPSEFPSQLQESLQELWQGVLDNTGKDPELPNCTLEDNATTHILLPVGDAEPEYLLEAFTEEGLQAELNRSQSLQEGGVWITCLEEPEDTFVYRMTFAPPDDP